MLLPKKKPYTGIIAPRNPRLILSVGFQLEGTKGMLSKATRARQRLVDIKNVATERQLIPGGLLPTSSLHFLSKALSVVKALLVGLGVLVEALVGAVSPLSKSVSMEK